MDRALTLDHLGHSPAHSMPPVSPQTATMLQSFSMKYQSPWSNLGYASLFFAVSEMLMLCDCITCVQITSH